MERYGAKNSHPRLLLDGKLTCSLCRGYITFRLRDRIAKYKTYQFNAHQIFPPYGIYILHAFICGICIRVKLLPPNPVRVQRNLLCLPHQRYGREAFNGTAANN